MSEAYHYIESGLDYVHLANGFFVEDSPYGQIVSIENPEGLHKAIGLSIVRSSHKMQPQELRYLRVEMELSQRQLGDLLDVSDQTIAHWEKGKNMIAGSAERLVRLFYLEFLDETSEVRALCNHLAELDRSDFVKELKFEDVDGLWKVAA